MTKKIIWLTATLIALLSILALMVVTFGSIIYFLYLWGGVGATVGVAAWTATKAWLITIAIAIPTAIIAFFITVLTK